MSHSGLATISLPITRKVHKGCLAVTVSTRARWVNGFYFHRLVQETQSFPCGQYRKVKICIKPQHEIPRWTRHKTDK
jgi:hypothetical protein